MVRKKSTKPKPPKPEPTPQHAESTAFGKLHPDFEEASVETSEGDGLRVVLPKVRMPVLARPGMAVALVGQSSDYGVITEVLAEFCIVRGCKGETIATTWGEVELIDVRPDPRFIGNNISDEFKVGIRGEDWTVVKDYRERDAGYEIVWDEREILADQRQSATAYMMAVAEAVKEICLKRRIPKPDKRKV